MFAKATPGGPAKKAGRTVTVCTCDKLSKDPACAKDLYTTVQSWQKSPSFVGPDLLFLDHFAPFLPEEHPAYAKTAKKFVVESPMLYAKEDDQIFGVLQAKKHDHDPQDYQRLVSAMNTYCPNCGSYDIEKDAENNECECWDCDHEFSLPGYGEGSFSAIASVEIARVVSKAIARLDSRSYKAFGILLARVCVFARNENVILLSLNPLDDSLEALYARFGFKRVGLSCYADRDTCAEKVEAYLSKHNINLNLE